MGAGLHSQDKEERCLNAKKSLHAKPDEILYIEDTERDIEIANTLGFDSCFAYRYHIRKTGMKCWVFTVAHLTNNV